MKPEDVPTIEDLLRDFGIDSHLDEHEFESLLDQLKNRENVMVTEFQKDEHL